MNKKYKKPALVLMVLFLFWGCNSPSYDILEIEEKVDISNTNTQDTSSISQNNNEIKEDLKTDSKILENKFTDKQIISRVYAVQIGAFINENNASIFTDKAKNKVDPSVYYKRYEGMYKVRIGSFNSVNDALSLLNKLKEIGYSDSFVVELTYVQSQEK